MNRFSLPVAVLLVALLAGAVLGGERRVIITKEPPRIFEGEVVAETDKFIEIKPEGDIATVKIPKDKIWKNLTQEEFRKQEKEIIRELRKALGIEVPEEEKLPEPVKVEKSHEIDKLKFNWVSAVISPIELEAPPEMGGFTFPPTEASYLVINYEVENGTKDKINVKGMFQRMCCVGTAKSDKDDNLEQIIFMLPYKGMPGPNPNLKKGDKLCDSIFFQAPVKEATKVTVMLDTDRVMHRGNGHLVLTVPVKEGAIDNAGTFEITFEEKPKKKKTQQMTAEVMKGVTFEITDIATRIVREEKMMDKGPSIDLAGEKMVIKFTVHNASKNKVTYIPILARKESFSQVARDNRGQTIHEYNPPQAYVCGRLRPTRTQPQVTMEPGEMIADIVVLDPPDEDAKYVRYLLDVTALFPKAKLDAMFNVKIFLKDGQVYTRKKPKFSLLKKRIPLQEKKALALVKDFVKKGADSFGEKYFGYRVIGQATITRIEERELEDGRILSIIFCEVGTDYQKGNKTSYMLGLMKVGNPLSGMSKGDKITYKGAIIGGDSQEGEEGPEHIVLLALKEAKKS